MRRTQTSSCCGGRTSFRPTNTRGRSAIPGSVLYTRSRWRICSPTCAGQIVAAGLLHDIVEDTQTSIDRIKELFGADIAHVVEGVTKLGAIPFSSSEERQAENFRKMLLAMVDDLRVILVKLADRLHNMRTLHHLPEERRVKIAQETRDIYAPIANRLG
jgi:GTP pyrophosphokinase